MPVFRVDKNKNYTVMSNHHLQNNSLTLKAKGLLSLMLSLPDTWDYTLFGLTKINDDGIDGIRAAVNELERHGYLNRRRVRNDKGQLTETEYTILEHPASEKPTLEKPMLENPILEKPTQEKPTLGNPMQLNTNPVIPKEKNTHAENINPSIYPAAPDESDQLPRKEIDRMDVYRELIMDNLEYDIMCERYSKDRIDEIVELMLETVCVNRKTIRIGGDDYPAEVVKSRLLKLNSSHVEYVFDCIDKNTTKVHNIKSYLLTTLYNAPATIDHYYTTLVNHDLYGR